MSISTETTVRQSCGYHVEARFNYNSGRCRMVKRFTALYQELAGAGKRDVLSAPR